MTRIFVSLAGLVWIILTLGSASSVLADASIPSDDLEGSQDNAILKRYEGSYIVFYEAFEFTDFTIPLSPLKKSADDTERDQNNNRIYRPEKQLEIEGKLTRLAYVLPEQRSPLEVLRNFEDVVADAGGEILFDCKHEECGGDPKRSSSGGGGSMSLMQFFLYDSQLKVKDFSNGYCALRSRIDDQRFFSARLAEKDGQGYVTVQTYSLNNSSSECAALNGRTVALVQILEPVERQEKMVVVNAEEMAQSLSSQGSISIYGVLFDFDKVDIKPESRPALDEVAKLLSDDPKLNILVVGHTDNQGSFEYNQDLSSRRAAAVVNELVTAYQVDPARLTAAGAGMMAPVASNDSEEGRSKNRRVELVKR